MELREVARSRLKFYRHLDHQFYDTTTSGSTGNGDRSDGRSAASEGTNRTYRRLIINGLRYLTDDLLVLKRMTLDEYTLRSHAQRLKECDQLALMAQQALFNRYTAATDRNGKYLVKKIEDIIDTQSVEQSVFGDAKREDELKRLHAIVKRVESKKKKRGSD